MTVKDTPATLMNCPHKTLNNPTIELSTPSISTPEAILSSQSPSLTDRKPNDLGSDFVSLSGSNRRRSRRLALKSDMADQGCGKNIVSSSRRKKSVSRESDRSLDSDSENARSKKARVFDAIEQNEGLGTVVAEQGGGSLEKTVSRVNDVNLEGSEACGSGERVEGGGKKSGVRELGKIGSIFGELNFDLNFPAPEVAEEGGSEEGFIENTHLGPVINEKQVEIICIDSDDDGEDGERLVHGVDVRGRGEGKEGRFGSERNGSFDIDFGRMSANPFVDGSNSMSGRRRYTKEEKGKGKVDDNWLTIANGERKGGLNPDFQRIDIDLTADGIDSMNGIRRYSEQEKGKGKIGDNWLSISTEPMHFDLELEADDQFDAAVSGLLFLSEFAEPEETSQEKEIEELECRRERAVLKAREKASSRRADARRNHEIARERASELAHVNSGQAAFLIGSADGKGEMPSVEGGKELEDFPGPFSTALKIIKERNLKLNAQQKTLLIEWSPSRDQDRYILAPHIPSLLDLSIDVLAKNAEAIVSLEPAPDALKHKLSQAVCDYRKMNGQFLELLVSGSPTEVRVKDCSWMTEDQFSNIMGNCDTKNLRVLQLDLCGQCMPDYTLRNTLACSSVRFPALATISLRGACRLSDIGLNALTESAPSLQSINLGQCSLLTSAGIDTLANCLGPTLRELYIDECQNIDALLILPALKKFKHLEILSVAGIQTVCDDFVSEIITALGTNMKELLLADCVKLTDASLKVIGNTCHRLCVLDLFNLDQLTDSAMLYLANGCQSIQALKLCRNGFSDEAIAAFLEVSGNSLKELSLNNVSKVGPNTALALSKYSRNLLSLDLSWCRKLMDEALGLIVDSCLSLRLLKLFGCTQITDVFLNGHSNSSVQIIGLKNMPVLKHLNVLEPQEAPLRYSPLTFSIKSQSLDHPDV